MLNTISNKVVPSLKDAPIYRDAIDYRVAETIGCSTNDHYMNQNYGRRIEPNKTWTIYHVFTGIPINISNRLMVGLSETEATTAMIALNAKNSKKRKVARREPAPNSQFSWFWGLISWH